MDFAGMNTATAGETVSETQTAAIETNFKFYKQINDNEEFSGSFLDWLCARYLEGQLRPAQLQFLSLRGEQGAWATIRLPGKMPIARIGWEQARRALRLGVS